MKKIGIDFPISKHAGGAYQYCLAFLDSLKDDKDNEYFILNSSPDLPALYGETFKIINLSSIEDKNSPRTFGFIKEYGYRLLLFLRLFFLVDLVFKFIYRDQIKMIEDLKLGLMLFPAGAKYAPYVTVPYISTIYDLEHRKHPNFPEVSKKGTWWSREHYYRLLTATAKFILVDSPTGKDDVINYYAMSPEKIIVLPYLPPNYLRPDLSKDEAVLILKKFDLPEQFIFYPAQFWPHKNHLNLVKAMAILRQRGIKIAVAFCGSKKDEWGEYGKVMRFVKDNNLDDSVFYLGYVDNDQISALYVLAQAMVMPTFFGPTNIPVLEAWKMGCPVLYSNIPGCADQLGDAGLLFNPTDPVDIADKIEVILKSDDSFRDGLIKKGKERLGGWNYSDFSGKIKELIKKI